MTKLSGPLPADVDEALGRIDDLVRMVEEQPDETVREAVFDLLRAVDVIHRASLHRLRELLEARALSDDAVRDPHVGLLFGLYGAQDKDSLRAVPSELERMDVSDAPAHPASSLSPAPVLIPVSAIGQRGRGAVLSGGCGGGGCGSAGDVGAGYGGVGQVRTGRHLAQAAAVSLDPNTSPARRSDDEHAPPRAPDPLQGGAERRSAGAPVDGATPEAAPREAAEPATRLRRRLPGHWTGAPRPRHGRRRNRWLLGACGVVIILVVSPWLGAMATDRNTPSGPSNAAPPAFVQYEDPQGRFSLSHPPGWKQEPSSASQAALLLRTAPSSQSSMLVRIVPLDEPVGPEQLAEAKKITDSLVQASDVNIVVVRQIALNGVPGYYYLYTFREPGSDRFGLHAHYFLFSGSTMHVLVFQALPDSQFVDLAPEFDAIARSYRVP